MQNNFGINHNWILKWKRIPSAYKSFSHMDINNLKEQHAVSALSKIGIIEKNQLFQLFHIKRENIKTMIKKGLIVEHELICNKRTYKIYSLGINGANYLNDNDYALNYWVKLKVKDVLKKLVFFEMYKHFLGSELITTSKPFEGAFRVKNNIIFVCVIKDNSDDLARKLKWNKNKDMSIIVISESLKQLKPLEPFFDKVKIRLAIEENITNPNTKRSELLLRYKDGKIIV